MNDAQTVGRWDSKMGHLCDLLRNGVKDVHGAWHKINTMFCDSAGISGAVASRLWDLGFRDHVVEINFGADSVDAKYKNQRAYMWGEMKDWMLTGAIDDNPRLESDLAAPGYSLDNRVRIQLEAKDEMKKRGLDSPDDADALALTFARHVAPEDTSRYEEEPWISRGELGWMAV